MFDKSPPQEFFDFFFVKNLHLFLEWNQVRSCVCQVRIYKKNRSKSDWSVSGKFLAYLFDTSMASFIYLCVIESRGVGHNSGGRPAAERGLFNILLMYKRSQEPSWQIRFSTFGSFLDLCFVFNSFWCYQGFLYTVEFFIRLLCIRYLNAAALFLFIPNFTPHRWHFVLISKTGRNIFFFFKSNKGVEEINWRG